MRSCCSFPLLVGACVVVSFCQIPVAYSQQQQKVTFINEGMGLLKVFTVDASGKETRQGEVRPGETGDFPTKPGTTWLFKRGNANSVVGEYVTQTDRDARYTPPLLPQVAKTRNNSPSGENSNNPNSPQDNSNASPRRNPADTPRNMSPDKPASNPDAKPDPNEITRLEFINPGNGPVVVFYLDEDNNEMEYDRIAANESGEFETYSGTVWRFKRGGKLVGELAWNSGDATTYRIPLSVASTNSNSRSTADNKSRSTTPSPSTPKPDNKPTAEPVTIPSELASQLVDGAQLSMEIANLPGMLIWAEFENKLDIDNADWSKFYNLRQAIPQVTLPIATLLWTVHLNEDDTFCLTGGLPEMTTAYKEANIGPYQGEQRIHLYIRDGKLTLGPPPKGPAEMRRASFTLTKGTKGGSWLLNTLASQQTAVASDPATEWRGGVRLNFVDALPVEMQASEHSSEFQVWLRADQPRVPPTKTAVAASYAAGFTGMPLPDEYCRYGYNLPRMNPLRLQDRGSKGAQPYLFRPIDPNQERTFYLYSDYRVPMDMWVIKSIYTAAKANQTVYMTEDEFARSFSTSLNVEGTAGIGAWSAGYGYGSTVGEQRSNLRSGSNSLRVASKFFCDYWMVAEKKRLRLSQEVLDYLLRPDFVGDQASYNEFFDIFGTHYPISTLFGGRATEVQRIDSETVSATISEALGASHSGSVSAGSFAKVEGKYSLNSEEMSKRMQSASKDETETHAEGGAGGDYATFARGKLEHNVPIKVDLRPIHEVIRPELAGPLNRWQRLRLKSIQEEMPRMLQQYLKPSESKQSESPLPVLAEFKLSKMNLKAPAGHDVAWIGGRITLIQDESVAKEIQRRLKTPDAGDPDQVKGGQLIFNTHESIFKGMYFTGNFASNGFWWHSGADQAAGNAAQPWAQGKETMVLAKLGPDGLFMSPKVWLYFNLEFKAGGTNSYLKSCSEFKIQDTSQLSVFDFAPGNSGQREQLASKNWASRKAFTFGPAYPVFDKTGTLTITFQVTPVPYSLTPTPDGLPNYPTK